jgi:hypothetical protein
LLLKERSKIIDACALQKAKMVFLGWGYLAKIQTPKKKPNNDITKNICL